MNNNERYGAISQILHWGIALLFLFVLGLGGYMHDLPNDPFKFELYALHKSLGITLLALVVVRLLWRLVNKTPALPQAMAGWEKKVARFTHIAMYILLFAIPISGWVLHSAVGFPLKVFGLFDLPMLVASDREIADFAANVHEIEAKIAIILILLHIAAALKHHFFNKDNVLRSMLPKFFFKGK